MRCWLLCLACPFLSGCLGFGYPSFTKTPEFKTSAVDVRAFRVISEVTMSGPRMPGPIQVGRSVEEIPILDDTVGPQSDGYFAYYFLLFPGLNGSRSRT